MANTPRHPDPNRPVVAISTGDPLGIGPEVTVKALAQSERRRSARFLLYGFNGPLLAAAERAGIDPYWWRIRRGSDLLDSASSQDVVLIDADPGPRDPDAPPLPADPLPADPLPGPTRSGGAASFRFVEDAIAAAMPASGRPPDAHAIVTAPISKQAWSLAGKRFPGHTELLAARFAAKRTRMMFVAPQLRVILATTHIPLASVRDALTIGRVYDTIEIGAGSCIELGIASPRIAVCGLNPHAGERGLFGDEESRLIEPAIKLARENGIDATGPWPADTIYNSAVRGAYDLVVAMYHDQGLIPVKLLAFDKAVNATVGLPTVRTSPDHGAAYDIAGKNLADPGSMAAAIDLAVRLAQGRRAASAAGSA